METKIKLAIISDAANQINNDEIKAEFDKFVKIANEFDEQIQAYNEKVQQINQTNAELANTNGVIIDLSAAKPLTDSEDQAAIRLLKANERFQSQLRSLLTLLETNPQALSKVPNELRSSLKSALKSVSDILDHQLHQAAELDNKLKLGQKEAASPKPSQSTPPKLR